MAELICALTQDYSFGCDTGAGGAKSYKVRKTGNNKIYIDECQTIPVE